MKILIDKNLKLWQYTLIVITIILSFYVVAHFANATETIQDSMTAGTSGTNYGGYSWHGVVQGFTLASTSTPFNKIQVKGYRYGYTTPYFDVYVYEGSTWGSKTLISTSTLLLSDFSDSLSEWETITLDSTEYFTATTSGMFWIKPHNTSQGDNSLYYLTRLNTATTTNKFRAYTSNTDTYSTHDGQTLNYKIIYEPTQVCGNGNIETPETCDDGNTTNYDGCNSTCVIETETYAEQNVVWQPIETSYTEVAMHAIGYIPSFTSSTANNLQAVGNSFSNREYGTTLTYNGVNFWANGTYTNMTEHLLLNIFDENRVLKHVIESSEPLEQGTSSQKILFYLTEAEALDYTDGAYFMVSTPQALTGANIYIARPYADTETIRYFYYGNTAGWRMDWCNDGDNTCPAGANTWNYITLMQLTYGDYIPVVSDDEIDTFSIQYPYMTDINNLYSVQCTDTDFPFIINFNTALPTTYYRVSANSYATLSTTTKTQLDAYVVYDLAEASGFTSKTGRFNLPDSFMATTSIEKYNITIKAYLTPNATSGTPYFYTAWDYDFLLNCENDPSLPSPYYTPPVVETNWFFTTIRSNFGTKFPFVYLFQIGDVFNGVLDTMNEMQDVAFTFHFTPNTTSTITFISSTTPTMFVGQPFWGVLRLIIIAFLWLAFVFYIYRRMKTFNIPIE